MDRTPPIITLTTDFGLADAYVASMKGVILTRAPAARIVDITHQIRPQDIVQGGFTLACAFPHFPPGTIHVLVVDPGVGTSRRLLLARTDHYYFLGPDNGGLAIAFAREPPREIVQLTVRDNFLEPVSATFHGRDILAPVAARLARGAPLAQFGDRVIAFEPSPLPPPEKLADGRVRLQVALADRFGNLILNLREEEHRRLREAGGESFSLEIAGRQIDRLLRTYGDADDAQPFALFNSSGYLEIAVRSGSAARVLSCAAGAPALLTP
jgi:S-adenosylmethionine hydrolase